MGQEFGAERFQAIQGCGEVAAGQQRQKFAASAGTGDHSIAQRMATARGFWSPCVCARQGLEAAALAAEAPPGLIGGQHDPPIRIDQQDPGFEAQGESGGAETGAIPVEHGHVDEGRDPLRIGGISVALDLDRSAGGAEALIPANRGILAGNLFGKPRGWVVAATLAGDRKVVIPLFRWIRVG